MNDSVRELGQRLVAAAWECSRALSEVDPDTGAAPEVVEVLRALAETEAQIAGVRLRLLHESRLAGAVKVADAELSATRSDAARSRAQARLGTDLGERFTVFAEALCEGRVSLAQVEAMVVGLKRLPGSVSAGDLQRCQRELLAHVDELGPAELRALALGVWELIDPVQAERLEGERLRREERRASAGRSFRLSDDFHGSMRLSGSLPLADAAALLAQLEALMPSLASYAADEVCTKDARRADALMRLAGIAAGSGEGPDHGGDRPHAHVVIPWSVLTDGVGAAALIGVEGGGEVTAGEARRMACDAGVIPVVLGGASAVADVGREQRTVPAAMRRILTYRDRGCVFPGCDTPPAACDAHHIDPWWAGGPTAVGNLVLLCPRHHRLIEPIPGQSRESQWETLIDPATGRALFVPPKQVDPERKPRRHRRFVLADVNLSQGEEEQAADDERGWGCEPWVPPDRPDPWAQPGGEGSCGPPG